MLQMRKSLLDLLNKGEIANTLTSKPEFVQWRNIWKQRILSQYESYKDEFNAVYNPIIANLIIMGQDYLKALKGVKEQLLKVVYSVCPQSAKSNLDLQSLNSKVLDIIGKAEQNRYKINHSILREAQLLLKSNTIEGTPLPERHAQDLKIIIESRDKEYRPRNDFGDKFDKLCFHIKPELIPEFLVPEEEPSPVADFSHLEKLLQIDLPDSQFKDRSTPLITSSQDQRHSPPPPNPSSKSKQSIDNVFSSCMESLKEVLKLLESDVKTKVLLSDLDKRLK